MLQVPDEFRKLLPYPERCQSCIDVSNCGPMEKDSCPAYQQYLKNQDKNCCQLDRDCSKCGIVKLKELAQSPVDIPPEFAKVIDDEFWNLT